VWAVAGLSRELTGPFGRRFIPNWGYENRPKRGHIPQRGYDKKVVRG
jgi:hypothetical protein